MLLLLLLKIKGSVILLSRDDYSQRVSADYDNNGAGRVARVSMCSDIRMIVDRLKYTRNKRASSQVSRKIIHARRGFL